MGGNIIHLGYISRSTGLMSDAQLDELLNQARTKNSLLSITGMLLYSDASFFQVIEGLADNVEGLFSSICSDDRHSDVRLLFKEEISDRNFARWSMGFQRISSNDMTQVPGMNYFLQDQEPLTDYLATDTKDGQMLKTIFTYFKQTA